MVLQASFHQAPPSCLYLSRCVANHSPVRLRL